jgi:type II secretory pathway pseudopilin PulG
MIFTSPPPPSNRRPRRSRSGFTVVEVAIAAAVMALAISGSIIVLQTGFKSIDNARNTTLASQIIQSEMERIRLLNWSDVDSLPSSEAIVISDIFPPGTTTTSLNSRFTATRVCGYVTGKANEMKYITITVSWTGIDGLTHTRSTTGYYCKNGLYDYYYTLPSS